MSTRGPRAKFPSLIGITSGDHRIGRDMISLAEGAEAGGLSWLILREPQLGERELVDLAKRLSPFFGGAFGAGLILHARNPAAVGVAERSGWGLHLPDGVGDLRPLRRRVRGLLGQSVHDAAGLAAASEAGLDYAILAPVFAPGSKPGDTRPPLGLDGLAALIRLARLPVYALGGIRPDRVPLCLQAGAAGVATISALFGAEATPESAAQAARDLLCAAGA